MATPSQKRNERRQISVLHPHPLQTIYYDEITEHDLRTLATDIEKNGLREPPHILPKNRVELPPDTILDGHMRVRAFELLGRTEIDVVVRYDLADADAATVEQEFLGFNFVRRQMDILAKARVAQRLFEIEKQRKRGGLRQSEVAEARDRVGAAIGMSGRHLFRYFRVLKTPIEVQNAFRARGLALVDAEKVADLETGDQQKIAQRIAAGESARAVVAEYLPEHDNRHKKTSTAFDNLVGSLRKGLRDLDGRLDQVSPKGAKRRLADLTAAHKAIGFLLELARTAKS